MTVLSAGPGWGKTTAVARWLASTEFPRDLSVAWLTLAPGVDDPASFWDGALRAIAGQWRGSPRAIPCRWCRQEMA